MFDDQSVSIEKGSAQHPLTEEPMNYPGGSYSGSTVTGSVTKETLKVKDALNSEQPAATTPMRAKRTGTESTKHMQKKNQGKQVAAKIMDVRFFLQGMCLKIKFLAQNKRVMKMMHGKNQLHKALLMKK